MAAEARVLSNRPKQMVYDGLTNEAYRALTQSFQLTNLDDIQTKGARYTSRKHLPKAANDQEYVKSTPSTRGMILRESGKIQLRSLSSSSESRAMWSPRKKEPLVVRFQTPQGERRLGRTRPREKPLNRNDAAPASTVTGLKFTGKPKEFFDFRNILDEVLLEPKRGKRTTWHDWLPAAGHGGQAYNGIGMFHPACFTS